MLLQAIDLGEAKVKEISVGEDQIWKEVGLLTPFDYNVDALKETFADGASGDKTRRELMDKIKFVHGGKEYDGTNERLLLFRNDVARVW